MEVPQTQVVELTRQVSAPSIKEVTRQIPKMETQVHERVVPVPLTLVQETAVEVPQVCVQEVVRQVMSTQQQQRIVQTGVEYERAARREDVVSSVSEPQFAGVYDAPHRLSEVVRGGGTMLGTQSVRTYM